MVQPLKKRGRGRNRRVEGVRPEGYYSREHFSTVNILSAIYELISLQGDLKKRKEEKS